MKECPNCKELIGNDVRVCFNCGYDMIYKRVKSQSEKNDAIKLEQEKRERQKLEEEKKQKQIDKNAKYEYIVENVPDEYSGEINTLKVQALLRKYADQGWKLHSVFRNELGRNMTAVGLGGVSSGSNATIEETIFIFERCIKRADD